MKIAKLIVALKTSAQTLAILCFTSSMLLAQKVVGIYVSANDFKIQKLTYASTISKTYRIKRQALNNAKHIKVKTGDEHFKILKDSLFGYVDKEGTAYRFYKHSSYNILSVDSNIVLYKLKTAPHTKYTEPTYEYYFSKQLDGKLFELTIHHLEKEYAEYKTLLLALALCNNNDMCLATYDTNHHQYKINYLLNLSNHKH